MEYQYERIMTVNMSAKQQQQQQQQQHCLRKEDYAQNPSICAHESDKYCEIIYLKNYTCIKSLILI